MNLLSWLFKKKESTISNSDAKIKSKYDGFDIEHLPQANRYFPRSGHFAWFFIWLNILVTSSYCFKN